MNSILPINLDNLLHCRGVESQRVEFKASWNPDTTGYQVLKTICAFANDYHNLNGGYIVIGVAEENSRAVMPPAGLSTEQLEEAQQWIRGGCNRLDPSYRPILSPEKIDGRHVLVVWAPASDIRPHRAPGGADGTLRYWIRLGSSTVDAERRGDMMRGLVEQTARVPWDDRQSLDTRVEDLREAKVREFLRDVRSGLIDEPSATEIYRRMRITARINDHEVPRNAGLLFFSSDPANWFPSAKIEVVQFAADRAGEVQEERIFGGGLADQVRDCLSYLENFTTHHLQKQHNRSQVRGWVSYPLPAIRETLVNAVYHRSYDIDQLEPTKVYLYPDRVEIISYPGPVPGIESRHLSVGAQPPAVPARNRRIGEFLKELGLAEGRLTGLPKVFQAMADNGSPTPRFEFDEQRTYFQATLPAHPEYRAITALRDAAHLRTLGEHEDAFRRIESAWLANQASAVLASEMIRACAERHELDGAEEVLRVFEENGPDHAVPHVLNSLIEVLIAADGIGEKQKALELLSQKRPAFFGQDAIDAAILARRAKEPRIAHRYFERAGETVYADARALLEFAQTKTRLSGMAHRKKNYDSSRRFLNEARTLLERVIQLDTSPTRHAWAWRELARTLNWLRAPTKDVEEAYGRAIKLHPDEPLFTKELQEFKDSRR